MALSLRRYTWQHYKTLDRILKVRSKKERERSIVMTTMISDPFPEDVWIEILSRLPVKDLVQFKCVCNSWKAIITSPNLISKHLKNYYHKSDSDCLIAQYCATQAGEVETWELLVDDEKPTVLSSKPFNDVPIHSPYIYGPCDGIFYMYGHFYDFRALWNPAINELKILPPLPNPPTGFSYSRQYDSYGFGLHPVSKDYTVVVMKEYWMDKEDEEEEDMEKEEVRYPLRVFIYSYITDSWRHWGDLSRYYHLRNNKCYICLNGIFCWLGSDKSCEDPQVMIYFDMATEKCQEIQLPDYDKSYDCESLAMYDDSIALLVVDQENCLHMWTLKERKWVKQFASTVTFPPFSYPIGHWKKNKLLLVSGSDELMSYDPDTKEMSGLGFSDQRCVGVFVYKESLVLVNNGNGCDEKYTRSYPVYSLSDSDSDDERPAVYFDD